MKKKKILGKSWTKKRIWKKQIYGQSLMKKKIWKKNKYEENPEPKKKYEKHKYEENPELKRKYEKKKYDKNPESKKENRKKMYKKNRKCLNNLENFCQQIRQGPYFIRTFSQWRLYKCSIRLFEHEQYILTAELYCLVRSFYEKTYICDTCHKHPSRNKMPCQAVFNKMSLDPIPDELKDLKVLEKKLITKRIIFKK